MHICPFVGNRCGPNKKVTFYKEMDEGAIHIKNLKKGDACVYNFEAVCGAPGVKIINGTNTNIFYQEWQKDSVPMNTPRVGLTFDSIAV